MNARTHCERTKTHGQHKVKPVAEHCRDVQSAIGKIRGILWVQDPASSQKLKALTVYDRGSTQKFGEHKIKSVAKHRQYVRTVNEKKHKT